MLGGGHWTLCVLLTCWLNVQNPLHQFPRNKSITSWQLLRPSTGKLQQEACVIVDFVHDCTSTAYVWFVCMSVCAINWSYDDDDDDDDDDDWWLMVMMMMMIDDWWLMMMIDDWWWLMMMIDDWWWLMMMMMMIDDDDDDDDWWLMIDDWWWWWQLGTLIWLTSD